MTMLDPRTRLRLTEEFRVDGAAATEFYELYLEVFGPLRWAAAARHLLERDEWDQEMHDQRIMKIVAWDEERPIGISLLALDLEAVPWASPDFYRLRYDGRPVYYCGISLVLPDYQGASVFSMMMRHAFEVIRRDGALGAWDCADITESATHLVDKLRTFAADDYPFEPEVVDTQRYYVVDLCDPPGPEAIDPPETDVIDLRDRAGSAVERRN